MVISSFARLVREPGDLVVGATNAIHAMELENREVQMLGLPPQFWKICRGRLEQKLQKREVSMSSKREFTALTPEELFSLDKCSRDQMLKAVQKKMDSLWKKIARLERMGSLLTDESWREFIKMEVVERQLLDWVPSMRNLTLTTVGRPEDVKNIETGESVKAEDSKKVVPA